MRIPRILSLIVVVSFLAILGAGCSEPPTYIVYIDEDGCNAVDLDGNKIDPLWVFPKDRVVWINTASMEMTIKFEDVSIFGVEDVPVAPGKRAILTVKSDATGSVDYSITPCSGGSGSPKVNVGDRP
jgi:hypothetical protein